MKPIKIKDSNRLGFIFFILSDKLVTAGLLKRWVFPAEIRWCHLTVQDLHTLHTCSELHIKWCTARWTTHNLEFCYTRKRPISTVLIYGNQCRMYRKTPRAQNSIPFSRCTSDDSVASVNYVCQRRNNDEIYFNKYAIVYC